MKQDIIIQLALLTELFERSGNKNLSLKHYSLHYSHGLRVCFFNGENIVNSWELTSDPTFDWESDLKELCSYATGYNDALFTVRNKI